MKKVACVLVCLLLSACAYDNNKLNGTLDDDGRKQREECVARGGKPTTFANGHSGYTIVCFAPEVLR